MSTPLYATFRFWDIEVVTPAARKPDWRSSSAPTRCCNLFRDSFSHFWVGSREPNEPNECFSFEVTFKVLFLEADLTSFDLLLMRNLLKLIGNIKHCSDPLTLAAIAYHVTAGIFLPTGT